MLGKALAVYGWTHRYGRLELIVVLPDGSKSLVPADWTDLPKGITAASDSETSGSLASVNQLLRVRAVVDALLARQQEKGKGEVHDSEP